MDLVDIVPLVRKRVKSCTDAEITYWLIEAAREIAKETRFLRETIVLDLVTDTEIYSLTPSTPLYEEIFGIKAVQIADGDILEPGAPEEVPQIGGLPTHYWYYPSDEIAVSPTPQADTADGLLVNVLLEPLRAVTWINDQFDENVVADGATMMLMAMPDKAWTDDKHAAYYGDKYETGKLKIRVAADKQHRSRNWFTRAHW